MSLLYSPVTLGPYTFKNRIAMSPMTRSRSQGNVPDDLVKITRVNDTEYVSVPLVAVEPARWIH